MIQTGVASYEELLADFTAALETALSGVGPSPTCATLSPTLLMSLEDIAGAVRGRRPTQSLVTLACAAFTVYAADRSPMRQSYRVRREAAAPAVLKRRVVAQSA
ncbi:hypothetical protein [Mycobacterium paraterrae]|uniref:Uncharacterized protein n=1 Tax=Mycobacterium paraterrae TaxID=577492 RepID=A0ABY3VF81_9MYCO|nr:hypothetical protein [Mycobacterium paraterrae]UMB68064.1 hypothetical protein MKK62_16535 [Mycobacterium paraterrae]